MFLKINNKSPAFPAGIRNFVVDLWVNGAPSILLAPNIVGVAGARRASPASLAFVEDYICNLPQDTVVVSGLALGTDAVAHKTALDCGLKTVAVLPCGADLVYPYRHRGLATEIIESGGALVSQYRPGTQARPATFVTRNKTIAGLSTEMIIGDVGRGTSHTVRFAKELGKPITFFK